MVLLICFNQMILFENNQKKTISTNQSASWARHLLMVDFLSAFVYLSLIKSNYLITLLFCPRKIEKSIIFLKILEIVADIDTILNHFPS